MAAARRLSGASWRVAVPAPSGLRVSSTFLTSFFSASRHFRFCPSPSDFEQFRRGEGLGSEDGARGEPGSHLPGDVGWPGECCAFAQRHDRFLAAGFRSDRFNDGALLTKIAFQKRGFAAKAKKEKNKVEHYEPIEDTAATAKANAEKMMETALDVLSREHSKLRTGRASAGILDHITVEAHGVRTPLNHIAAVTVSGLQTLNVLPYDASMIKEVEKAILNSPMGLNPQVDGATITVPLPRLTKEHCETMCKLASKAGEAAKLTIRRSRKEALDAAKSSGNLSKDEMKRFEKEVEELTKKYTKSVEEMCKAKDKEIMA